MLNMLRPIGALLVKMLGLTATLGCLLGVLHAQAAVVVPSQSINADGTTNLSVQLNPPVSNKQYAFYVAGAYNGQIFFLGQDGGWQPWDNVAADIPAALIGANSQTITILSKTNVSGLVGASFFAGVGLDPKDLLSNGSVTHIYTVVPPPCVTLDCMSFGGKLEFQTKTGNASPVSLQSTVTAHLASNGTFTANADNGCRINGQLSKQTSPYGALNLWSGPATVSSCADAAFNGNQNLIVSFDASLEAMSIAMAKLNISTFTAIAVSGQLQKN